MITLYIKTHQITGLKYFGMTSANDPHKYKGSGKHWKRHIRIHGYKVVANGTVKQHKGWRCERTEE